MERSAWRAAAARRSHSSVDPWPGTMLDAVVARHEKVGRHAEEQAVLDDPRTRVQLASQRVHIRDRAKGAVEDQVALVGPERVAVRGLAQGHSGPQLLQKAALGAPAKGNDF